MCACSRVGVTTSSRLDRSPRCTTSLASARGGLLEAVGSGAGRESIFTAALDELERTPTLVVFEDMHWADEATLDLLKFLGRRIERTRSILAVSYRDDDVGPGHSLRMVIGDLPRASVRRMLLAPLSESAVAQLARRASRGSEGLYGITGGNPLFLTEVLAAGDDSVPLVCVVPGRTEPWLLRDLDVPVLRGRLAHFFNQR